MGFASYFENIAERFYDTQKYFQTEISGLRKKLQDSDLMDRKDVANEIDALKKRLNRFLDELDTRSAKLFEEARERLSDRQVNLVAYMKKRDLQLADARKERDEVKKKFERTRELNAKLVAERDTLSKERSVLRKRLQLLEAENEKNKRKAQDRREWEAAMGDVRRR
ncbi:MAG TPA: hypothetical protein VLC74_01750 [Rhizomicrobium sp.]|nr:hypothetical protein [Rhizomicrobium sp.]